MWWAMHTDINYLDDLKEGYHNRICNQMLNKINLKHIKYKFVTLVSIVHMGSVAQFTDH